MNRTLRFTLVLLAAASAAFAQTGAVGTPAPAYMADSLRAAAPADTLAPSALPDTPAAPAVPTSASLASTPMPARPHVLVIRTEAVIRNERDQVQILAQAADADLITAKRARTEVSGAIEIKKKDIAALGARLKAAKQAKDDATRATVDAERRRQESVRDYFLHLQDVQDAAVDEAQARGDFARAALRATDWELRLTGRTGVTANDGDPALFKMEQQYLDAVKSRAGAEQHWADTAQTLADRKLRLYRAWADWLGGR